MKWFVRFRQRGMKRRINKLVRKINREPIERQELEAKYYRLKILHGRKVQSINAFEKKHEI